MHSKYLLIIYQCTSDYPLLHCRLRFFTNRVGNREEIVSTSCLQPSSDDVAEPGVPRHRGRPPNASEVAKPAAHCHSGPPATKRVSFLDPLVSTPSQRPQERLSTSPWTVFIPPCRGIFARPGMTSTSQPPQNQYPQCQWSQPARLDVWPCLLQRQSSGRTPMEAAYTHAVPATVWEICTLCTLLHALEMYSPFVNTACLYIYCCVYVINDQCCFYCLSRFIIFYHTSSVCTLSRGSTEHLPIFSKVFVDR